jgi:predicted nucleic acid-binding protein
VTVFVLDSSAVLRHHDDEAGAGRVEAIFETCARGSGTMRISAVQWGEVAAIQRKRFGEKEEKLILQRLMRTDLLIVPATAERAVHAAELRVDRKLPYADAFAIELAMDSPDHVLVTADFDFKAVADLAHIEFLPAK